MPDERGLLTLGWYGTFLPVTQTYSGPGLAVLGQQGVPRPAAAARAPGVDGARGPGADRRARTSAVALPAPGWLLHATRDDGIVRLVNHGSDRDRIQDPAGLPDPHYLKLAYTSHTGPDLGEAAGVDGELVVVAPDGAVSRRRRIEPLATQDRFAASAYLDYLPAGPVRVVTASVVDGPAEVRIHQVTAPAGHQVRDGGHALAGDAPLTWQSGDAGGDVGGHVGGDVGGDVWASARRADGLVSVVRGLHGYTGAGVATAEGANAFGRHSATPYVIADAHPGGTAVYVSLVLLTGADETPRPPVVRVEGDQVTLDLPGGDSATIRLTGTPTCARATNGGSASLNVS